MSYPRAAATPTRRTEAVVGAVSAILLIVLASLFLSGTLGGARSEGGAAGASGERPEVASPGGRDSGGVEVLPQGTGSDAVPLVPVGGPLVNAPFPASGSARGALVDGFPAPVIGPMPGAAVLQTSMSSGADAMQATLVAQTESAPANVIAFYRHLWTSLGRPPTEVEGMGDLAYTGAFESFTLVVAPVVGAPTRYAISAIFHSD